MFGDQAATEKLSGVKLDLVELADRPGRARDRRRLAAVAILSLLLHSGALYLLERRPDSPPPPLEEAIPVEIVTEPPPEPEAEQTPEVDKAPDTPQPAEKIEEKPVDDYARSSDREDADGKDSEPPPEPKPEEKPAPEPPEQKPVEEKPQPPEPVAPPEPEGLEPPAPEPAPEPPPTPPVLAPTRPSFDAQALLKPMPNYEFKAPAKKTDGPRGNAEPGYLSTLYARIMREMRHPIVPSTRRLQGRVVFAIQGNGRIMDAQVSIPSGDSALDAAALAAVRKASPYPAPPSRGTVFIRFDYGAK